MACVFGDYSSPNIHTVNLQFIRSARTMHCIFIRTALRKCIHYMQYCASACIMQYFLCIHILQYCASARIMLHVCFPIAFSVHSNPLLGFEAPPTLCETAMGSLGRG